MDTLLPRGMFAVKSSRATGCHSAGSATNRQPENAFEPFKRFQAAFYLRGGWQYKLLCNANRYAKQAVIRLFKRNGFAKHFAC